MIERNFKNHIIWKDDEDTTLSISPVSESFNKSEILEVLSFNPTDNLVRQGETTTKSESVRIRCFKESNVVNVEIVFPGVPPYKLKRGGSVIDRDLLPEDFPYQQSISSLPPNPDLCYRIVDDSGNTYESCC